MQEIANYIIKEAGLSIINLHGDGILNWHINPRKISELVSILSWNGKIDNPWNLISTDQSKKQNEESTYMKTISSKQVTSNLASKTKTDTQEDFVKTMKEKNMIVHEL
jgi:hypothetical protein